MFTGASRQIPPIVALIASAPSIQRYFTMGAESASEGLYLLNDGATDSAYLFSPHSRSARITKELVTATQAQDRMSAPDTGLLLVADTNY